MSVKLKSTVYRKTNGHCAYCGNGLDPFYGWEIEHMIPRSRGGSDDLANLVPACTRCNRLKGTRTPHEFKGRLVQRLDEKLREVQWDAISIFVRSPGDRGDDEFWLSMWEKIGQLCYEMATADVTFYMEKIGLVDEIPQWDHLAEWGVQDEE